MIAVREISEPAALVTLAGEWDALFDRAADPTPFQSWQWQEAFWRHRAAGRLWLLEARRGGELVGLMPLFVSRYRGTPLRQLRFLGAPLSDMQEILAAKGEELAVRDALIGYLAGQTRRWELCDFADQREGSPLTQPLGASEARALRPRLVHHRICPFIRLPASWPELLARLSKNTRSNLGRRQRQLAKQFQVEHRLADAATLDAALGDLFRLHNRRWRRRGAAGAFADPAIQAFHREVARRFLDRGWLRLHLLRLDGETRAAYYCFALGRRVYYYLSGFDLDFAKYSIGNVLLARALESAIGEGAAEFDFLRGDEAYKLAFGAESRRTERLVLAHPAWRSSLAVGLHWFERFVEHRGLALQRRLWGRRPGAAAESAGTPAE